MIRAFLTLVLLALLPVARSTAAEPYFAEVAAAAGVDVVHRTRSFDNPYARIMEGYTALGASAAVADIDGDGLEDVYVTDSSVQGRNLLWRNVSTEDSLRFVDIAGPAGVAAGNDPHNASADSLFFDMDSDGDPDLLLVRFGHNLLFENVSADGEIRFRDVTAGSGLERYANCVAAIAFDADGDGDLDLLTADYFAPVNLFDPETPRFFPESFEAATNGGGVTLWLNQGRSEDGGPVRFDDATVAAGMGGFTGWSLDVGHADIDRDGDEDVFVAADFGSDRLFRNDSSAGGVAFTDVTAEALGIDTKKGMNADWGDFDGDGDFDLYVTNITDEYLQEGNFLWQNLTDPGGEIAFADVAGETGSLDTGWGWAGKFFDYDNDGRLDLYVANGWVSGSDENYVVDVFELITSPDVDLADARLWPAMGEKTLSGYQRNVLFHNEDGYFVDRAARHGVDSLLDGRGVAVADFNRDGRLDLFVTNAGKAPYLFRGAMPRDASGAPHWLQLRLVGSASNRDAIGARVRVTVGAGTDARHLWSYVNGGNGFASQSTRTQHFGLGGAAEPVGLQVIWPSGRQQEVPTVAIDRLHVLHEDEGLISGAPGSRTSGPRPPAGRGGPSPTRAPTMGDATEVPPSALPTPELPADGHAELARGSASRGDHDTALRQYELALAADPSDLRLGSEYRQVVIEAEDYRRCLGFWKGLARAHPDEPAVLMNLGYAHVDKIPAEGAITQVILANRANEHFGRALEILEQQARDGRTIDLELLWLAYYTRGSSYMFWPAIFGRTPAGIADLQRALELAEQIEQGESAADVRARPAYRGRAWAALGDGHWRLGERAAMREAWRRGLERYPECEELQARLALGDEDVDAYLGVVYEPRTRVATHLREIWSWHDAR